MIRQSQLQDAEDEQMHYTNGKRNQKKNTQKK